MKILSLFSGIGAFEKAFDHLKIPYELVGYCEIDKYASKSYSAIHNVPESMNLGDITKVDEKALPKDMDLITYGFPCQDISLAGKQKGLFNEDGTQTRSGLFFEALRIIEETQPRVAIAENVKNLTGKTFKEQFKIVLDSLEQAGYNNYWKVLNAKDFGIPQNRERVFIVSIRQDIDTECFEFPEGFPLELRLKDILEAEVDEKYYLSDKPFIVTDNNSVKVREATKTGYAEAVEGDSINLEQPNSKTRRGRVGKQVAQTLTTTPQQAVIEPMALDEQNGYIRKDGCVGTLTTDGSSPKHNNRVVQTDLRIRKLTPKECFRLMGFDDSDFEKAEAVNSNTQLYKQAGNSIVVSVVEYIIKELCACGVFEANKPIAKTRKASAEQLMYVEISANMSADDVKALNAFFRSRDIPKTHYVIH